MKTVLFIPGFMENFESRNYAAVLKTIESKGFTAKFVSIKWKYTTPDNWLAELEEVYEQYESEQIVLAGFSFGAIVAFLAATRRSPSELWLFSLSPYFAEDMSSMKKYWLRIIGKRRADYFRRMTFNDKAAEIDCETSIFVGEKEIAKYPSMEARSLDAAEKIRSSRLIRMPSTGHDVAAEKYLKAIEKNI